MLGHLVRIASGRHLNITVELADVRLGRLSALVLTLFALCLVLSGCGGLVVNQSALVSLLSIPASINFGTVTVGQSATASIPILNKSLVAVEIAKLEVDGQTFSLNGSINLPVTIAPGSTLQLQVRFNPSISGQTTGQLIVATGSSHDGAAVVQLNGDGANQGSPALSGFSCASASLTGPATDLCTITMSAPAQGTGFSIGLSSSNAALAVPVAVSVPAGAVSATFTATASAVTQAQSVTLIAASASGSVSFAVQLNPALSVLSANAAAINFGIVALQTAATQSVILTCTGSAPVTISTVSVTGAGFTLEPASLPTALEPGQSVTLDIDFAPASAAAATGQLVIGSNASQGAAILIPLSGSGTQFGVQLSWSAPTSTTDTIAGYHVYRSPSTSAAYQIISSTGANSTTYEDSTVQSGTSYDYVVKAVDNSGVESAPSNMTTATIP